MDNRPRPVGIANRREQPEPAWALHVSDPEPAPVDVGDWAWKLGLALVAAPVVVVGGLSWLLATWAGSWFAPLVAATLLVPLVVLTAWAKRATGWVFLLTASFAAAGMLNWFGGPASLEHIERSGETSQVNAEPVAGVTHNPG